MNPINPPPRVSQGQTIPRELLFPVLPRPACRVILVSGPPGGGKSSFVNEKRLPDDILIDLDDIKAELSGLPIYRAGAEWDLPALTARNERLESLAAEASQRVAYVLVTAPGAAWHWWRAALRPVRVVPLVPLMQVALDRIERDPRRVHDLERHRAVCRRWYEVEHYAMARRWSRFRPVANELESADLEQVTHDD